MRSIGLVAAEASPKPARAVVFLHCEAGTALGSLDKKRDPSQSAARQDPHCYPAAGRTGCLVGPEGGASNYPSAPASSAHGRGSSKVDLPAFKSSSGLRKGSSRRCGGLRN